MIRTVTLLVLVSLASSTPVSPELEPKSSKKFFGKDNPVDNHPPATKYFAFDHPYPGVQDSGDFEKDYTKDENTDGGKWEAQMEYDILRQKVREAEKELAALKKKMDEEAAEMQEAYDKWQEALDKVKAAEAAVAEAKEDEAAANAKVNSIQDQVDDAAAKVEKEMKDMEGCKKALADAKQRLKDLMDKQARQKKELAEKKEHEAAIAKAHKEGDMDEKEARAEDAGQEGGSSGG